MHVHVIKLCGMMGIEGEIKSRIQIMFRVEFIACCICLISDDNLQMLDMNFEENTFSPHVSCSKKLNWRQS